MAEIVGTLTRIAGESSLDSNQMRRFSSPLLLIAGLACAQTILIAGGKSPRSGTAPRCEFLRMRSALAAAGLDVYWEGPIERIDGSPARCRAPRSG